MNNCTHGYIVGSCAVCATPEDAKMFSRMLLRAFREKPENQTPKDFVNNLLFNNGPTIVSTTPNEKTTEEMAAFIKYILNQGYVP